MNSKHYILTHHPFFLSEKSFVNTSFGRISDDIESLGKIENFIILTHGFTAHRSDVIPWGVRVLNEKTAFVAFDLPGHFLGSHQTLEDYFLDETFLHQCLSVGLSHPRTNPLDTIEWCCIEIFHKLRQHYLLKLPGVKNIIFGGHSFGGFLALKALSINSLFHLSVQNDSKFHHRSFLGISLGTGLSPDQQSPWELPLFKEALLYRKCWVDPYYFQQDFWSWLHQKKRLFVSDADFFPGTQLYLFTGANDLICPPLHIDFFQQNFANFSAILTTQKLPHLPHHQPELFASHFQKWIEKILLK